MKCPICGKPNTKVVDSRNSGSLRRRRRICVKCDYKFSTTELPGNCKEGELPLFADQTVRKRTGDTERFDPAKLRRSVEHATRRADVARAAVLDACDKVNARALKSDDRLVTSADIKRWTMAALMKVSREGALRYASQYLDSKELARHRIAIDGKGK